MFYQINLLVIKKKITSSEFVEMCDFRFLIVNPLVFFIFEK